MGEFTNLLHGSYEFTDLHAESLHENFTSQSHTVSFSLTHVDVCERPDGIKRVLNYFKCEQCRRDKKKCEPVDRSWPANRCNYCVRYNKPCGPNVASYHAPQAAVQRLNKENPQTAESTGILLADTSVPLVTAEQLTATAKLKFSPVHSQFLKPCHSLWFHRTSSQIPLTPQPGSVGLDGMMWPCIHIPCDVRGVPIMGEPAKIILLPLMPLSEIFLHRWSSLHADFEHGRDNNNDLILGRRWKQLIEQFQSLEILLLMLWDPEPLAQSYLPALNDVTYDWFEQDFQATKRSLVLPELKLREICFKLTGLMEMLLRIRDQGSDSQSVRFLVEEARRRAKRVL